MRVLVTGSNGLLGRQLVSDLVDDHDVIGVVHSRISDPIPGVEYITSDLSQGVRSCDLPSSIDSVVHLAQSSRFRDFPDGVRDTFGVNVSATLDLLEYGRQSGARQFFLASTGGVYEEHHGPVNEAGALIPPSRLGLYFASKLSAEMIASTYRQCFEVCILRFFFMFGPRQRPDMFLPRLVNRVLSHDPLLIDESGGIKVNPIHVSDASRLITRIVGREAPHVLNVAGPQVVSIQQIGNMIGDHLKMSPTWTFGPSAPDIVADITAMSRYLPRSELMPFKEGLEQLVRSVKSII